MNSICLRLTSLLACLLCLCEPALSTHGLDVRILQRWQAGLIYPTDLALDSSGRAWVTDGVNNRCVILSPGQKSVTMVEDSHFGRLMGICRSEEGMILTDTKHRQLHFLNEKGEWQGLLQLPDSCDPVDVLLLPDRIIVTDNDNHRVLILNRQGQLMRTVGKDSQQFNPPVVLLESGLETGVTGELAGEFTFPGMLSEFSEGFLVVDVIGGRVQSFTELGNFVRAFGSFRTDGQGLFRPKGASFLQQSKRLVVSDGYVGTVTVFDRWGERTGLLGLDQHPWLLKGPTAVHAVPQSSDDGIIRSEGEKCWFVDCLASTVYYVEIK